MAPMSNMVTRCPKCGTAFRITANQLQSAKGAVRCGSCLHIFRAQDHLVSGAAPRTDSALTRKTASAPREPAAASPAKPAAQTPEKTSTTATSAATTSKPANAQTASPTTATVAAATSTQMPSSKAPASSVPEKDKLAFNQKELDKEIAASEEDDFLISDDMDKPADAGKGSYDFDGFLDLDNPPKSSTSLFDRKPRQHPEADEEEKEADADESWAQSLLEDADDDNKIAAVKHTISAAEDDPVPADEAEETESEATSHGLMFSFVGEVPSTPPSESELKEIFTEEELRAELHSQNDISGPAISAYDSSRAALLMSITPEPVEMTASHAPRGRRTKLWPLLALAMLVLLILQLAWLQFDHLSRIQPYRSAYEVICPWVGCQVPVLADRSKFRVRNLVVTKHRDVEDALKVDLILINTASFDQPFPDLYMVFSSLEGELQASRRFTPRDYLAGELAGRQTMPHNRPIHISLELVDPGEKAVNYKIEPL